MNNAGAGPRKAAEFATLIYAKEDAMEKYVLKANQTADLGALARWIEGLDGKVERMLGRIKVITFLIQPEMISAVEALPGVSAIAPDCKVQLS